MVQIGEKAPDFKLKADDGSTFELSSCAGERVLLVFYPGDNTPVCTRQLCDYRDGVQQFAGLGVRVVGISPDDTESHRDFKEKYGLPFSLLSDSKLEVADEYGARGVLGMKRAVFLLDERQTVRYAHVEAVALFRRQRDELIEVIRNLDEAQTQ